MRTFERRTTFRVGEVKITVLDRTEIHPYQRERGFVVTARKEPVAVIIEDETGETPRRYSLRN